MHTTRLALLTVLGALAAAASLAPAASAADQRYASPTGSGDACTAASPCEITKAIAGATTGAEVIVTPGDYPLPGGLSAPNQVTIHGVAGRPRPRLLLNSQNHVTMYEGALLRYVEIVQTTPSSYALYSLSGAKLDQVVVKAAAGTYCAVRTYSGTISNSVVVAPGSDTSAICAESGAGTSTNSYRNVTAIATGSGVAIEAYAAGSAKVTVTLLNVIARSGAGGVGLLMHTSNVGAEATITASRTNFANYSTSGTTAHFVDGGANQATPPHFVDPGPGDYRQAPGSVTIDAGLDENIDGAFDVDGDPRKIGATDIGADEFAVAPAATTGPAGAVTDRSATLSGGVSPSGTATSYQFEYGPTTAYGTISSAANAGSGGAVAATAGIDGLSPGTTYHYRIVASNAGGITKGADRTFTTLPAAAPRTPTPTAPALPFAGVELVSRKLTYARRLITVRLRCPAGTVGRCSGRASLTARQRGTSARRVTLGRASFSIAAGGRTALKVRVTRAGRRLLERVPRLRGRAVNVARDGASQSKTTTAAVTIRRRPR